MRIGIDLGGTKTEILCLDDHGDEIYRQRIPTIRGNYEKTVQSIRDLVLQAEQKIGQSGTVGIGIPGSISQKTGLVKNANSTWLIGHPFQDDLGQALGREIRMSNDANCFALSEAVDGVAAPYANVFGVIIGTGTGGGLVVDKKVIGGVNGIAGEWGHNAMPWVNETEVIGPDCYCGYRGCIETFLCGPALSRLYQHMWGEDIQAVEITNAPIKKRDPVLALYETYLARALASIINVFDPDAIVLGGGVSNIDRWYQTVPNIWSQWVFGRECDTKLLKAKHGDSSGVRGAAWLWPLDFS